MTKILSLVPYYCYSRTLSPPNTMALPIPTVAPSTSKSVAVIGAGAAGLCAARALTREGHRVVVFERDYSNLGGTWVYTDATEADPLGTDPTREVVHSSVYASLRTNLPREVMGFREYPFVATGGTGRDPRRFPGHSEVLEYLKAYAEKFGLRELVRFGTEVRWVGLEEGGAMWRLRAGKNKEEEVDESFDAVVVCNGHYSEPRIANIPGIDLWPGKQIHSHNYRVPGPFRDQVVVLIGSAASAVDISRDIASVAKEVHIVARSNIDGKQGRLPSYDNIWIQSMIVDACEDGKVFFQDGSAVHADIILHCTGYKYHFPFLETKGTVTVDDNCVGPLYKHIFPPSLAPWLSFVGLPWKVVPFPQFEYQTEWIAGTLSGRILLPSAAAMMKDIEAFYSSLDSSGIPKRYTHNMGSYQFDYNDWLAAECGCPPTEGWRKEMYSYTSGNRTAHPETYRDEWEDEHLILVANEDFKKLSLGISK